MDHHQQNDREPSSPGPRGGEIQRENQNSDSYTVPRLPAMWRESFGAAHAEQHNQTPLPQGSGMVAVTPRKTDVLIGKGRGISDWEGNRRFQQVVDAHYRFVSSQPRMQRGQAYVKIVEKVKEWGRFLQRDRESGLWHVADDAKAVKKMGQAMRHKLRQESNAAGIVSRQLHSSLSSYDTEETASSRRTSFSSCRSQSISSLGIEEGLETPSSPSLRAKLSDAPSSNPNESKDFKSTLFVNPGQSLQQMLFADSAPTLQNTENILSASAIESKAVDEVDAAKRTGSLKKQEEEAGNPNSKPRARLSWTASKPKYSDSVTFGSLSFGNEEVEEESRRMVVDPHNHPSGNADKRGSFAISNARAAASSLLTSLSFQDAVLPQKQALQESVSFSWDHATLDTLPCSLVSSSNPSSQSNGGCATAQELRPSFRTLSPSVEPLVFKEDVGEDEIDKLICSYKEPPASWDPSPNLPPPPPPHAATAARYHFESKPASSSTTTIATAAAASSSSLPKKAPSPLLTDHEILSAIGFGNVALDPSYTPWDSSDEDNFSISDNSISFG